MPFGQKAPIGLDIGTASIKVSQLRERKGGYDLEVFDILPLPPELIVDGAIIDSLRVIDAIREIIRKAKIKTKDTVLSVSGHSAVIVKLITLPEMTEEELEESIRFEAEQYIPFDINDVSIDFQIIGPKEEPGQMEVLLVAVKSDILNDYIAVVREAGLNPVVVDVDFFALENIFEVNYEIEPGRVVGLVDIGASSIKMNILKGGTPAFTRDTPTGTNILVEALQREFELSYEVAERLLRGEAVEGVMEESAEQIVMETSEELITEISRSIDYFRTSMTGEDVSELILAGGGALVKGLADRIRDRIGVEVSLIDPFRNITISRKLDDAHIRDMAPLAAVSLGLALRRVGDR